MAVTRLDARESKVSGYTVKVGIGGTTRELLILHHGKASAIYDDSFIDRTSVMHKELLEKRQWHTSGVNDYENSEIDGWLNGDYYNSIDPQIRELITEVKIPYRPGSGASSTVNSGENGLATKVFLPSAYEIGISSTSYVPADGTAFDYFAGADNAKRIAYLNGTATHWWLRSPYTNDAISAWAVYPAGTVSSSGCYASYGIRPVFTLPSSLLVDDEGNIIVDTVGYLDVAYGAPPSDRRPTAAKFYIHDKRLETAETVIYRACNNLDDVTPTWEVAEEGKSHTFVNATKTADQWRVGVRVTAEKGDVNEMQAGEDEKLVGYENA